MNFIFEWREKDRKREREGGKEGTERGREGINTSVSNFIVHTNHLDWDPIFSHALSNANSCGLQTAHGIARTKE